MERLPARALYIKEQWAEEILEGRKTWEIRGRRLHIRGRVALAASGTGRLIGEVVFVDCLEVGHRDAAGALVPGAEADLFIGRPDNYCKHGISDVSQVTYARVYAWVMEAPRRYHPAVPFQRKAGQVGFIDLTQDKVLPGGQTTEQATETRRRARKRPACRN